MLELVAVALAGICFGAGMGASKNGAPRALITMSYILSGMFGMVAVGALVFR